MMYIFTGSAHISAQSALPETQDMYADNLSPPLSRRRDIPPILYPDQINVELQINRTL